MTDTAPVASEQCDIVIIGGGPAGSTAATLLARRGHRVVVLEKEHHPRFHIGESLLPMNLPIFQRLGVLEKVHALGVFKGGADFEADNDKGYNSFDFARALGKSPPHAYQVWRQDFDRMLFEHARENGADGREGHEVRSVEELGLHDWRVQVATDEGKAYALRARYVIDASGRDAFLAGKRKLKRKNPEHQSAAIFGHFRNAERRPGEHAGNISMYRFDHGWMWMIPLPDGVMSVGAVCWPEYLKQRRGRTVEFLRETLSKNEALWKRLEHAELISDEVRVTGNYSYDAAQIGGPGWMLVGDAFAFLDPVFSSGVYLAMSGAEKVAEVVDGALRDPRREAALQQRLEKRMRKGMSRFAFFIYRFNGPIIRQMFRDPRNTFQIEQGVISMLAGDVFDSLKVQLRILLFRGVYAAQALLNWRRWSSDRRDRLEQARSRFSGGNTSVDPE